MTTEKQLMLLSHAAKNYLRAYRRDSHFADPTYTGVKCRDDLLAAAAGLADAAAPFKAALTPLPSASAADNDDPYDDRLAGVPIKEREETNDVGEAFEGG